MANQKVAELSNTDLTTATFAELTAKTVPMVSNQLNVADLKEKITDRENYILKVIKPQEKILSRLRRRLSLLDPEEAREKRTVLRAMFTDPSYECKNVISINGYYESTLPQRITQNGNITTPEALSTTSSPGTSHETSPARSLEESLRQTVRRVMEKVYGEMSSSESSSGKSSPTDRNGIDLNSEPTLAANGSRDFITINDNNRMYARVGRPIKTARRRINKAQTATAEKSKTRKAAQSENTPEPEVVTILPTPASEEEEVTEDAMETSFVTGEVDAVDAKTEKETVIEYDHEKPYPARVKATDNVEPIHESLAETRQPRTQTNRPEVMRAGVYDRKDFLWFLHLMPTEPAKEYAAKVSERQNAQMNAPRMTRRSNAGVTGAFKNHEVSSPLKKHKVAGTKQKKGGNKPAKMSSK